jgi:hypothetical protein
MGKGLAVALSITGTPDGSDGKSALCSLLRSHRANPIADLRYRTDIRTLDRYEQNWPKLYTREGYNESVILSRLEVRFNRLPAGPLPPR